MAEEKIKPKTDIFIVDGTRTPFLKVSGKPGPFTASDLAVEAGKVLLARQPFAPSDLGEVIIGCVGPREYEANIARYVSLRLGCGNQVPAYTVGRNCGSGLEAIDGAYKDMQLGRYDLVLAGGTESMSHSPLIFNDQMTKWFADLNSTKSFIGKLNVLAKFRFSYLKPIISLVSGLTDHTVGMIMGQTAEKLAHFFHINRKEMDEYALMSHQRAAQAHDQGYFKDEMVTMYDKDGNIYDHDTGVRRDSSMEKLGKLKPIFDKFGSVTAGNSAQVTDGASLVIMATKDAIKKYNLPKLGRIVDIVWSGYAPDCMGLTPVFAVNELLKRNHLKFEDIDYWELNEAFASQVLACLKAWADPEFSKKELHRDQPLGTMDRLRFNVDGGAVALGHPVGASAARITLHLLNVMKRNNAKLGIASMCIGGGQAGAVLLASSSANAETAS